jgi:TPR repeat protein
LNRKNKDRNPVKALEFLRKACTGNHVPSCYNLAVIYKLGDTGIPVNIDKHEEFKAKTWELKKVYGLKNDKIKGIGGRVG